jgi:molybdopterin molybdotransferase
VIGVAEAESQLFAWADRILAADSNGHANNDAMELSNARSALISEGLEADRDFPPFDRVTMDGIAIRFSDLRDGLQQLRIAGVQAAGRPPLQLQAPGECLEVMTGAVLPAGSDTVIRYEDLEISEGIARVQAECIPTVTMGQNIQRRASECAAGAQLIAPGKVWCSPHWALAASVGKLSLKCKRQLRIAILATGDELVPPEAVPCPHEIRASNPFALAAALHDHGFEAVTTGIVGDDPAALIEELGEKLGQLDVCILTGAVSAGKFDHVPVTLRQLGVTQVFHRVRQRPGKPLWFGVSGTGTLVFALPGNPVSALVGCYRYVIPTLRRRLGYPAATSCFQAELAEVIRSNASMTCFIPVVECEPGSALRTVRPLKFIAGLHALGSGDLVALAQSDGFVECPEGVAEHMPGTRLRYFPWERM